MLKDKVNIQVLKVDRRLITLFKPVFRGKEIWRSEMSIFFEILARIFYRSTQLRRGKSTGRDSRCFAYEKMSNSFYKYDNKHACTRSSLRASLPFPRFFRSIYGPRASRLGHKSMGKNSIRNLQYGPKTRLIRGIYLLVKNKKRGEMGWGLKEKGAYC